VTARAGSGVTAYAARRAVQQHFVAKMDKEVTDSLADAMWNLHYGPSGGGRSYETCLTTLRAWSESTLNDAYYDVQSGEVLESEPQSWEDEDGNVVEPNTDDYMRFDVSDVKRLMFADLIAHGGF
jgi:hypothetical protein